VTIWTELKTDMLRLCIQDVGPGIKESERDKLFTEFGKLSSRPTGNESSTGLGLWIVKHLLQKQGGTAGASFPGDGGSIFWIELPAFKEKKDELLAVETA
jgi:signal transduction histidine kinase